MDREIHENLTHITIFAFKLVPRLPQISNPAPHLLSTILKDLRPQLKKLVHGRGESKVEG